MKWSYELLRISGCATQCHLRRFRPDQVRTERAHTVTHTLGHFHQLAQYAWSFWPAWSFPGVQMFARHRNPLSEFRNIFQA